MTDLGSKNPLQLAYSGYQDTKIFGTKVLGGSLDFNLEEFSNRKAYVKYIWKPTMSERLKNIYIPKQTKFGVDNREFMI